MVFFLLSLEAAAVQAGRERRRASCDQQITDRDAIAVPRSDLRPSWLLACSLPLLACRPVILYATDGTYPTTWMDGCHGRIYIDRTGCGRTHKYIKKIVIIVKFLPYSHPYSKIIRTHKSSAPSYICSSSATDGCLACPATSPYHGPSCMHHAKPLLHACALSRVYQLYCPCPCTYVENTACAFVCCV